MWIWTLVGYFNVALFIVIWRFYCCQTGLVAAGKIATTGLLYSAHGVDCKKPKTNKKKLTRKEIAQIVAGMIAHL